MDTNTPENQPAEGRDGKHHGQGVAIVGGAIVFVIVVLLVLPGFLAAWFSRVEKEDCPFSMNDYGVCWHIYHYEPGQSVSYREELAILVPSGWIMERSVAVRRFYNWEFHLAGGRDSVSPLLQ